MGNNGVSVARQSSVAAGCHTVIPEEVRHPDKLNIIGDR